VKDAGDLAIEPGLRMVGRVVLSDGGVIPPDAKVFLSRDDAWDTATTDLRPDGRFEFSDVPAGSVNLGVRIAGYRISEKNRSLDRLNGSTLVGRIDQDIVGLELLLEPGKFMPPDFRKPGGLGPNMQPRDKPLRGTESPNF